MARRTFADDSMPKAERNAHRLLAALAQRKERQFSVREIQRLKLKGLSRKEDLDPAQRKLDEGELIPPVPTASTPKGGAPMRLYLVNPVVFRKAW